MTDRMTCEGFWQRALGADELELDAAMKAHLEVCADCREEMRMLALLEKTRAEPNQAQLEALARRMGEAGASRRLRSAHWRVRPWIPLAAAACGALILLGLHVSGASETEGTEGADAGGRLFVGASLAPKANPAAARGGMSSDALSPAERGQSPNAADFFAVDDEGERLPGNSMSHSMGQFEEFFDLGG